MAHTYEVTVSSKVRIAGEREGTLEVVAKDAKEAVKRARQEMSNRGHTRQDGALIYKARKVES